jgi:predicted ATPase/DNA-binding XRE family transcriptional regulator
MEFNAPFHVWLKQRRKALDLTRNQLAGRINYSVETLHKVEGGALKPSHALIEQLIAPLEIPADQHHAFMQFAAGALQAAHRHNLPAPTDTLIGRGPALVAAHKLLRNRNARLITFIGPPGVGKTRLALQAAWDMRDHFADGAWFVPLGALNEPGLVPMAIARAAGVPVAEARVVESIQQHFREQQVLLVLDNFEHVLEAAPLVEQLLSGAPRLKVMVTSRSALHLAGEHLFSVDVLSPDAGMAMFVQRTEAIRPTFCVNGNKEVILEICRQLDGLPLAIELAAARMRMFEPPQLLALMQTPFNVLTLRHRDSITHRRALREALAESERLLTPEAADAFRRLSIFMGGCSLPAAVAVLGAGAVQPVTDCLQVLADHSLIRMHPCEDETRIHMLHTIREYGLERLRSSGEYAATARRHAEYYTDFAEFCEADAPEVQLQKFNEEGGNLRAALAFARRAGDALMQMRLLASFGQWQGMQWQAEDLDWLNGLFAQPATQAPALKRIRARALSVAGFSVLFLLDEGWSHAQAMLEESARLFEALGDVDAQASSLSKLGCILWNVSDLEGCIRASQRALEMEEGKGAKFSSAMANGLIASALRDRGDDAQAVQRFTRSIEQFEALGDSSMAAFQHNGMGDLEFNCGRLAEAHACYERALVSWKAGGSEGEIANRGLGRIAYVQGHLKRAHDLLDRAVSVQRQWNNHADLSFTLHHLAWVKHQMGEPAAAALMQEALHLQQRRTCRISLVESLERCAWMAAGQDAARAATLFGAAEALRRSSGMVFPLGDKALQDTYLATVRASLDEASFAAAWAAGEAMPLEAAIAFAMSGITG